MDTLSDALGSLSSALGPGVDAPAVAAAPPAVAPGVSLRDRLKGGAVETLTTKLPVSDVSVTYPSFVSHDRVMGATKFAGKNRSKVGTILIAQVCLFEGERLAADEIGSLLHVRDVTHLINLLFSEADEDEDVEGN